jgi:hypothetical protein
LLFVPLLGVNRAALQALGAGGAAGRYIRIDWREDLLLA